MMMMRAGYARKKKGLPVFFSPSRSAAHARTGPAVSSRAVLSSFYRTAASGQEKEEEEEEAHSSILASRAPGLSLPLPRCRGDLLFFFLLSSLFFSRTPHPRRSLFFFASYVTPRIVELQKGFFTRSQLASVFFFPHPHAHTAANQLLPTLFSNFFLLCPGFLRVLHSFQSFRSEASFRFEFHTFSTK